MSRLRLAQHIGEDFKIPQHYARHIVESVLSELARQIATDRCVIKGFGTFNMKVREPRMVRNPKTGEKFLKPKQLTVQFMPSEQLIEELALHTDGPEPATETERRPPDLKVRLVKGLEKR